MEAEGSLHLEQLLTRIAADPENDDLLGQAAELRLPSELVPYLDSDSSGSRLAAIIALREIAGKPGGARGVEIEGICRNALDKLIRALDDEKSAIRKAALGAMRGIVKSYWFETRLMDMLNPALRGHTDRTFEPVVARLDDESIDVSLTAADVLSAFAGRKNRDGYTWGDKEQSARARAVLLDALDHESTDVAVRAATRLDSFEFDEEVRNRAKEVIRERRAAEVGPLIEALKDPQAHVREDAVLQLGRIGDKRAVGPLIEALEDDEESVRVQVIEVLASLGDKSAVPPLADVLGDENPDHREKAAWALGMIGDPTAIEPLIEALNDESDDVRCWAASSLGSIGDERAVVALERAARDEDEDVREEAAEALEEIRGASE